MKKREGQIFLISEEAKKRIKENQCPACGLYKDKWKRRKDWRCCSKKCSTEFYKNYGYVSWQQFRMKAIKRDKYRCVKCGKKPLQSFTEKRQKTKPNPSALIGDHIIPIALGGEEFDINNVQTLCIPCNKIKTAQDIKDIAHARREEKINDHHIQGKLRTGKIIKVKVTKESQEEMNKIRKKVGFKEKPIVPEYELEALLK